MATPQNAGRVRPVAKGEYSATTTYDQLDWVTFQGGSYIAKAPTTGNPPTNTQYWMQTAKQGDTGTIGPQGIQGIQGPKGEQGDQGPKGDTGADFVVLDYYQTLEALIAGVPNPCPGDAYGVNPSAPYDIYIYGETSGWINNGPIQGPKGDTGAAGADGKTAYQSAVDGGYGGTESQFHTDLAAMTGLAEVLATL